MNHIFGGLMSHQNETETSRMNAISKVKQVT